MRGEHEAYRRVGETCAEVWRQVGRALEATLPFLTSEVISEARDAAAEAAQDYGATVVRGGLIECEAELLDANKEIDILQDQVEDLKAEIEELNETIRRLEQG